jgi:nitroimidazol reductase NimA-like FMN-containing flavoprotein (pyridoxamine 5'-phosphate oxidase superfamily)
VRSELTEDEARFVGAERVARLAVVDPEGAPRVAPICPVLDGDAILVASDPGAKLDSLRREPRCALVFDTYVEDWNLLHQVRIRGTARLIEDGPEWDRGKRLLDEKYLQYEPQAPMRPDKTVIIAVRIEHVTSEGF